jgi:hypothetical protein
VCPENDESDQGEAFHRSTPSSNTLAQGAGSLRGGGRRLAAGISGPRVGEIIIPIPPRSLLDLAHIRDGETAPKSRRRRAIPAGLVVDLEDLLGCRVQVVTEEGLYWLLRERILNEAEAL